MSVFESEIIIDENVLKELNKHLITARGRKLRGALRAIMLIVVIGGLISQDMIFMLVGITVIVGSYLRPMLTAKREIAQHLERMRESYGTTEMKCKTLFSDDAIITFNHHSNGTTTLSYDDISRVVETEHMYVFLTKAKQYVVASKESFKQGQDCEEFISHIEKKCKLKIELDSLKKKARQFKVKWWHYLVAALFVILIALMLIIVVQNNRLNMSSVRYRQTQIGAHAMAQIRVMEAAETVYFEDVESAISYISYAGPQTAEKILQFEKSPYLLMFFSTTMVGIRSQMPIIHSVLLFEDEIGVLHLKYGWVQGIESLIYDARGVWHPDERVARDVIIAYVYAEITARANENIPLFYGVGPGVRPTQISIMGYEPDNIISFEHDGEEYFFWYFRSAPQFGEVLSEHIDALSIFSLAEVIAVLDIQVVK